MVHRCEQARGLYLAHASGYRLCFTENPQHEQGQSIGRTSQGALRLAYAADYQPCITGNPQREQGQSIGRVLHVVVSRTHANGDNLLFLLSHINVRDPNAIQRELRCSKFQTLTNARDWLPYLKFVPQLQQPVFNFQIRHSFKLLHISGYQHHIFTQSMSRYE